MNQRGLFDGDPEKGKRTREDGINRAWDHAGDATQADLDRAVRLAAAQLQEFTTDAVLARIAVPVREKRALGGAMRRAVTAGLVEATGRVRVSDHAPCHRRPKAIWYSLIWSAAAPPA